MAEDAKDKILLTPNNILGIIQRDLLELHAYLNRAPQDVDLDAVMKHLSTMAGWVNRMPPQNTYMPADTAGAEKRAN